MTSRIHDIEVLFVIIAFKSQHKAVSTLTKQRRATQNGAIYCAINGQFYHTTTEKKS